MLYFEDNFPNWLSGVNFKKLVTFTNGISVTGGNTSLGTVNSSLNVVAETANATLTAAQSGTLFLFNVAAGATLTLPAAAVGLTYGFAVQTSITSNSAKVTVGSSNGFLIGAVQSAASSGGATDQWVGNGSSHISVTQNCTTTGGLQGSYFTVTCIYAGSTPLWLVDGELIGSGTLATPFATT